jgi:hypothetical protein
MVRRKLNRVGKIEVHRHQAPSLNAANIDQFSVFGPTKALAQDSFHIEPICEEELPTGSTKVLVEFDLHANASIYRSRVISEPYPIHARMSSRSSWGYSERTSSVDIPLASISRIRETQIRCPRIHGFPKQTSGSIEILASRLGFTTLR